MAQVKVEKQVNNFTRGLITEANPLTYPDNASLDEENFDLEVDGSRERRLGIDFESSYVSTSTTYTENQLKASRQSFHRWDFPGGSTTVVIGVIRVNGKLWFCNLLTNSPSANLVNKQGTATPVVMTISGLANNEIETAVVNNFFVIVSKDLPLPILLSYDASTDTVSQETLTLKVRDIWGVNDALGIDERPTSLTNKHKYNLRNQGWSSKITSICAAPNADCIDCTYATITKYPSNADQWTLGKVGSETPANFEKYDPNKLVKNAIDNYEVAKGSFIINALGARGTNRISVSGVTGLDTDTENGYLTTVAAYAGRLFYSGITSSITSGDSYSPNYSGYIFFSQIAKSKDKLYKCYQEADPTSPNISDIIDTDGGTIQIPEASRIVKLIPAGTSLIALAENGVWEIYGDTGGFTATSYQSNKVSSVGINNPKAVVDANGTIVYWAISGIYALTQDPTTGRYISENISIQTIQTYYTSIPNLAKQNARGFYDSKHNHIRWIYNVDDTYSTSNYINGYNRELNLDLTLKAFYKFKIESLVSNTPRVVDYIDIPNYSPEISDQDASYSFLTLRGGTYFTISKYKNTTFKDWVTEDTIGVDFSSYLVTGYELFKDILKKKQVPYILFYFTRTEENFVASGSDFILDNQSSCLVQAQWAWTDSANSGKWGTQFQAYRLLRPYVPSGVGAFDYGESVIITKNKLRGSGKCLSLKIQSETGKDMKLLGWAMDVTGTSEV